MKSTDGEALDIVSVIRRLRKEGTDDACYEAKSCDMRLSADVWESVSAFANTSGGILLLGLDERNRFSPSEHFDTAPSSAGQFSANPGTARDQTMPAMYNGMSLIAPAS